MSIVAHSKLTCYVGQHYPTPEVAHLSYFVLFLSWSYILLCPSVAIALRMGIQPAVGHSIHYN